MCVDPVCLRRRSEGGFTLIEVLVALLILTIGLLGLEALGIGAARTLAMSEKQSQVTSLAATAMEELRAGITNSTVTLPNTTDSTATVVATLGDTVVVSRIRQPIATNRARLTVRVAPKTTRTGRAVVQAKAVRLDSYIWHTRLP